MSGLASGVDMVAHATCREQGGRTIGVLATPLDHADSRESRILQKRIAREHLLVSQVPFRRYGEQSPSLNNRMFVPERDVTMSALSDATVIVEVSETGGALHQARTAQEQGRALFIDASCFGRAGLTWPAQFEQQGAVRVNTINDLLDRLIDLPARSVEGSNSVVRDVLPMVSG